MMRRGMTILEMLLALALLGAVCTLLTSWLTTIARFGATHGPCMEWRSAAVQALRAMEDDLACGDFEPPERGRAVKPRVEIVEGRVLRLATRSTSAYDPAHPGAAIHEYRLEESTRILLIGIGGSEGRSDRRVERSLLCDVAQLDFELDEEKGVLTVTIRARSGDEVRRNLSWP